MNRSADRRRRLLRMGRTDSTVGRGTPDPVPVAGTPVDDSYETRDVSSNILVPDPGEKFFAACGGRDRAPRLRIVGDDGSDTIEFDFRRPYVLVGRSERCDLRFEHPDVSYRHTYLQLAQGRLHCFDLASRTGTRWADGSRISGFIAPHSRIAIGPYTIENLDEAQRDPFDSSVIFTDPEREECELPAAYLEWIPSGGSRRRTAALGRPVTLLGWSRSCHVRLSRDQVSRVHASLVLTGEGVWAVDLLGRGGTLLDGKRIVFARLRDGSELQIGTFGFRLRLGEPPPETARRRRPRRPGADVVINQNIVIAPAAPGSTAPMGVTTSTGGPVEVRSVNDLPRIETQAAGAPDPPFSPPASGGLSEGFVLSLFSQFTQLQREIFSQSQQQMMFVTQLLGSLHRSQQELIHEEFRRVNEINRELHLIQAQLFRESLGSGPRLPVPVPEAEAGDVVDAAFDFASGPAAGEDARGTSEAAGQAGANAADAAGDGLSEGAGSQAGHPGTGPLPDDESSTAPADAPVQSERTGRDSASVVDQHAWLIQRMAGLERERRGRWKKIMSMLTGGR